MARYIDEKDVYALVEPMGTARVHCSQIDDLPRADVVPKSEVEHLEREVRLLTENSITAKYSHCVIGSYYAVLTKSLEDYEKVIADISSAAKAEVAREIFEEMYGKVASKIEPYIRPICKGDLGFDAGFRNGKTDALIEVLVLIAELKKKYTEG